MLCGGTRDSRGGVGGVDIFVDAAEFVGEGARGDFDVGAGGTFESDAIDVAGEWGGGGAFICGDGIRGGGCGDVWDVLSVAP